MLCALRKSRSVTLLPLFIVLVWVLLKSRSHFYDQAITPALKDEIIRQSKEILKEISEDYDYTEMKMKIPIWKEFTPNDVKIEKDIFFIESKGLTLL